MKFEKRGDGTQEPSGSAPQSTPAQTTHSKKPVIIYIMIMFIVAFLLMTLSFFMHQRSNTEVLGELQSSVNAMQAVQDTQEKVIALQEELAQYQDHVDKLTENVEDLREELDQADLEKQALMGLYTLQQRYANQDLEGCQEILTHMELKGLVELLPKESQDQETPPYDRFGQLKDAVLSK